jgi:hypothetical protein
MPCENKNDNVAQNNMQQQISDEHWVPDKTSGVHQWHIVKMLLKSNWKNNKRNSLVQWDGVSKPTWELSNIISQLLKQIFHGPRKRRKRVT